MDHRPPQRVHTKHGTQIDGLAARTMEGAAGLPVGVQVLTRPFHDETCVEALRALDAARPVANLQPTPQHRDHAPAGAARGGAPPQMLSPQLSDADVQQGSDEIRST